MEIRTIGLIMSFFLLDFTLGQWTLAGTSQSFTVVSTNLDITYVNRWYFQETNILLECGAFPNVSCYPNYVEKYKANITSNMTAFINVFTINYVTPLEDNTTLICRTGGLQFTKFYIKVYAIPESPKCHEVTVLDERILIKCFSMKVFPSFRCIFKLKTNFSIENELINGALTYSYGEYDTTGYYEAMCMYNVPADILGPGYHMFRVIMYPNITQIETGEMKSSSNFTNEIEMNYPKACLNVDCKVNAFIKEHSNSSCTCFNNNTGVLSTNLVWYKGDSFISSTEKLSFQAKRNDSFQCTIKNSLNWTDTIIFQPKVSYPPDNITINIKNTDLDMCNKGNALIAGNCLVSESNPEPSVYFKINNSVTEITSLKNEKSYMINLAKNSTGIFNVICIANSTEFSYVKSIIRTITIKGPPGKPMILINNKEIDIQSNKLIEAEAGDTITCLSTGGYPPFKNVTLKCGTDENYEPNSDQVTATLKVSNASQVNCECIVWHESKCLPNRTTVFLKVSERLPVSNQDFQMIYMGVGLALSFVVLFFTLLFIGINLHQSHIKKSWSNGESDKLVVNEDIYFIQKERTVINISIYPEYTNVVTTMSSAMEAPRNLKITKG